MIKIIQVKSHMLATIVTKSLEIPTMSRYMKGLIQVKKHMVTTIVTKNLEIPALLRHMKGFIQVKSSVAQIPLIKDHTELHRPGIKV